ncbi:MAG: helix-turn-helix transcriptional regulator [Bacillota bacterium]
MAREKFQTLTEQMFYVLLVLQEECYGADIMEKVGFITNDRVKIGAGTLYSLLESFLSVKMIEETKVEGRKRCYKITEIGKTTMQKEANRLEILSGHFAKYWKGGETYEKH